MDGIPAKADFFISHTRVDGEWALWMEGVLHLAGYRCVIEQLDFDPGGNALVDMDQGLIAADRLLLVLSPEALASPWVVTEWTTVFRHDPLGLKRLLVPVKVRPCEPAGLLGPRTYIDLVGLSGSAAERKLLDGLIPARRRRGFRPHPFPGRAS